MNERWISLQDVASRLGISVPTARKHITSGVIPGRHLKFDVARIDRKVFESWAKNTTAAKGAKGAT